jgi:putative transposase
MARPLRVEYPGAYYHIMNRGNRREDIFISNYDREKFLAYLAIITERFSINVHTYCLMNNHYHLLIETSEPNLSNAVKWLNGSYATDVNTKRKKGGHLFQGRFKSIIIEADEYLKHLSRYIHLNPVRAKIVENPSDFKWSSYPAFIGKEKEPEWLETNWLLSCFGKSKKEGKRNYKQFVEDIDVKAVENPHKNLIGGFILGETDFADWIKETFLSGKKEDKEIPQLKRLKPRLTPDAIVEGVCEEFSTDKDSVIKKGAKRNKARDMAIYLSKDKCGITCKELGEYYGNVSGATITMAYNRIEKEINRNKRFKGRLNKIKKRILNI